MRTLLVIIIVFAALGYFLFGYGPQEKKDYIAPQNDEEQLREELGIEAKSYRRGIDEGVHNLKNVFRK